MIGVDLTPVNGSKQISEKTSESDTRHHRKTNRFNTTKKERILIFEKKLSLSMKGLKKARKNGFVLEK